MHRLRARTAGRADEDHLRDRFNIYQWWAFAARGRSTPNTHDLGVELADIEIN